MTSAYEWIITTRSFYRTRIELLSAAFPRLHSLPNKISELFSRTKFDDWKKKKDQLWGYNNIPAKAEILKTQYSSDITSKIRIYRNIFEPPPPKFRYWKKLPVDIYWENLILDKNENFEQCQSAENVKRGDLWRFENPVCCKISKIKGCNKKNSKKVSVRKQI